jgi:hypothetical protein
MSDPTQWGWDFACRKSDARLARVRKRSRSPPRALPPLRKDAPGRLERTRGALPTLATEEQRSAARSSFEKDVYATSTRRVLEAKLVTVSKAFALWGREPLPPSIESVTELGATLKAGGYRSASSYLTAYRGLIERSGYSIDGPLARSFRDAARSCERGLGGSVRARATGGHSPWVTGGPISPETLSSAGRGG